MRCTACDRDLEGVFRDRIDHFQYRNALWVGFFGGYGMFVDHVDMGRHDLSTIAGSTHEAVLCHECAHGLCDAVPWVRRLLDPYNSHAHVTHDPGHVGWDIDGRGETGPIYDGYDYTSPIWEEAQEASSPSARRRRHDPICLEGLSPAERLEVVRSVDPDSCEYCRVIRWVREGDSRSRNEGEK